MRALLVAVLVLSACSAPAPTPVRPGAAAVYERIAASTDCAALQREFDVASAAFDATADLARRDVALSYMKAAEARRRELSCASNR